jgi:hypothetical protein
VAPVNLLASVRTALRQAMAAQAPAHIVDALANASGALVSFEQTDLDISTPILSTHMKSARADAHAALIMFEEWEKRKANPK